MLRPSVSTGPVRNADGGRDDTVSTVTDNCLCGKQLTSQKVCTKSIPGQMIVAFYVLQTTLISSFPDHSGFIQYDVGRTFRNFSC